MAYSEKQQMKARNIADRFYSTPGTIVLGALLILATLACQGEQSDPTQGVTVIPEATADTGTAVNSNPPAVQDPSRRPTSESAAAPPSLAAQALYRAIWEGTIDEVRQLVADRADVNTRDADGEPLLYTAIWRGEPEKVQILVNAGADVDARDSDDDPLLYTAVWRDKPEALKILVEAGADVNAKRANGESLLYVARWRGYGEIEEVLLSAGATE